MFGATPMTSSSGMKRSGRRRRGRPIITKNSQFLRIRICKLFRLIFPLFLLYFPLHLCIYLFMSNPYYFRNLRSYFQKRILCNYYLCTYYSIKFLLGKFVAQSSKIPLLRNVSKKCSGLIIRLLSWLHI